MTGDIRTSRFEAQAPIDKVGLVKGVSVLSEGEAQGHNVFIDAKSIQTAYSAASAKAGGVRVKFNHSSGLDRIVGCLKNFRVDGKQLRGDLQLLQSHSAFSLISELIATQPATFGLSLAFQWEGEEIQKKTFVRFVAVFSCDLVEQPAANPTGLFTSNPEPPKTFGAAVAQFSLQGMTEADAVRRAVKEHTPLWVAWREAGCIEPLTTGLDQPGNFQALVHAHQKHGKGKGEAVTFCVNKFPRAYAEWRQSGNTAHL